MKNHAIHARKKYLEAVKPSSVTLLYAGEAPHKTLDQYYPFSVNRNFYYLTGLNAPALILMMVKGVSDTQTYLFIEETTDLILKWEGARLSAQEAHEASGIALENIRYLDQFEGVFNAMMNYARSPFGAPPQTVYLDLYHVSVQRPPEALLKASSILEHYPELTKENSNGILASLRMIKSAEELAYLKEAIAFNHAGLNGVVKRLKERQNEHQVASDFLYESRLAGSEGLAFDTIAAGGKNATVLHYVANNQALQNDALLLIDCGAIHAQYNSDITRTYPIQGVFTPRQKEIYEAVLDVNKATIEKIKPGITWAELNAFAKERLAAHAIRLKVIDRVEDVGQVYYHSIGHFLGLDVHDVGLYDQPLQAGMVLTIEPGLYLKEEGIGVRIEDDIVVTATGYENLSQDIPKEVSDIESLMHS